MLTCNMDVEERSVWLRATPAPLPWRSPLLHRGRQLYGRAHFATARTDKDSYILFLHPVRQRSDRAERPAHRAACGQRPCC